MNSALDVAYKAYSNYSKSPTDSEGRRYKTNQGNLLIFMAVMVLSGATQGYIDYSNQAACLYNVKYGWHTEEDIAYNQ